MQWNFIGSWSTCPSLINGLRGSRCRFSYEVLSPTILCAYKVLSQNIPCAYEVLGQIIFCAYKMLSQNIFMRC